MIVVTGATGHLGRAIVEALGRGSEPGYTWSLVKPG